VKRLKPHGLTGPVNERQTGRIVGRHQIGIDPLGQLVEVIDCITDVHIGKAVEHEGAIVDLPRGDLLP
jgi:hypothetical protein